MLRAIVKNLLNKTKQSIAIVSTSFVFMTTAGVKVYQNVEFMTFIAITILFFLLCCIVVIIMLQIDLKAYEKNLDKVTQNRDSLSEIHEKLNEKDEKISGENSQLKGFLVTILIGNSHSGIPDEDRAEIIRIITKGDD